MANARSSDYLEFLDEELRDPTFALDYLNAAIRDEDPKTFLVVIGDIMRTQNRSITRVAKSIGVSREHLYRMLSLKGNPTFTNILALLDALDFEIAIQPKGKPKRKRKVMTRKRHKGLSSTSNQKSQRPSISR